MQAGWYPTDCAVVGRQLFVLDGKGEGARPNPDYRRGDRDYIGAIEFGSLRAYDLTASAQEAVRKARPAGSGRKPV